ncbi:unnamed protein product [Enterobius vermicularis]|uniref:F-BAR domain-containing protein n=1 Tax=Enterobius vermicularis TaxID=51028 RepID=A0A0N4V8Z0_ENTVE|nr:unnamed protein product [Enterobius vermicularis]
MENNIEGGFYEIGAYRHNARRYKEGIDELADIQEMLKERIGLETFYCKSLRAFHERWLSHAEKASSNSVKTIWKEVLGESAELGRLHGNLKDRISDEIVKTITIYLKDNYHSSPFRSAKEVRDIEEQFEKVQRPWKKQLEKVEKARKLFHNASQKERSASVQKKNADGDPSISTDNARKYEARWQKTKEDVSSFETLYRRSVADLDAIKNDYIAQMCDRHFRQRHKHIMTKTILGEVIEVLREPDSLNWCIGRKDGKKGLFPAAYVERLK